MIKFFRHVRKSLLEQNKMGKYFKYAIGEIILVVIGILIALQLNNWNQNRINTIEVNQSLKKLVVELNKDLFELDNEINQNIKIIKNLDSCLLILKQPENYSKQQFNRLFHYVNYTISFEYNNVTFDEFSNSGKLKQLENSKLADSLINYYGNLEYKSAENALINHVRDFVRPYTLSFDFLDFNDKLDKSQASDFGVRKKSIKDYSSDNRILNAIRFKILLHRFCTNYYRSIIPKAEYLIKVLEKELKNT